MSDFGFASPWILLALIPLWAGALAAGPWLRRRRRSLPVARQHLALEVLRQHPLLRATLAIPRVARLLALSLIVVALARPQTTDEEVITGEGIDILFAVDMSGSMNAVDMTDERIDAYHDADLEPPNRFELARELLRRFVQARREDRLGLVVFGREAYLKFPLTLDYDRVLAQLDGLVLDDGRRSGGNDRCANTCTINGSGTAIGDALARAYRRLRRSKAKSRVIVLITDGKNEGGSIDPDTMLEQLAGLPDGDRVEVYTILVGDPALTRLPLVDPFTGGLARDGRGRLRYQQPNRSFPTDPALLRRIAERTGGQFWESPDDQAFRAAFEELERTLFQREVTVRHREIFLWPLLAAIALLLLEGLFDAFVLRRVP